MDEYVLLVTHEPAPLRQESRFSMLLPNGIVASRGWKTEGAGTSEGEGRTSCLTTCQGDVSCRVPKGKLGWNPPGKLG